MELGEIGAPVLGTVFYPKDDITEPIYTFYIISYNKFYQVKYKIFYFYKKIYYYIMGKYKLFKVRRHQNKRD